MPKYKAKDLPEYDVFISHANKDKENLIEELYQSLQKLGISIFYDKESLEWGDNWKERILNGTKKFDDFSEDNLYNQILKVTIECLIRAKDVDLKRKQALKKLLVFFGNVKDIRTDHIQWSRLIYQRNNRNYETMCKFLYVGQ